MWVKEPDIEARRCLDSQGLNQHINGEAHKGCHILYLDISRQ